MSPTLIHHHMDHSSLLLLFACNFPLQQWEKPGSRHLPPNSLTVQFQCPCNGFRIVKFRYNWPPVFNLETRDMCCREVYKILSSCRRRRWCLSVRLDHFLCVALSVVATFSAELLGRQCLDY